MHPRCKSICRLVFLLLPLTLLLSFSQGVSGAWAQYDTYTGTFSFKGTSNDLGENGKFSKNYFKESGTVEFYIGSSGPVQNGEGYFLKFVDAMGTRVGITDLALLKTNAPGSTNDVLKGVGFGVFFANDDAGLNDDKGPVYADINGKIYKDKSGNIIKISLTVKMAGAISGSSSGHNFVWSGTPKFKMMLGPQNTQ